MTIVRTLLTGLRLAARQTARAPRQALLSLRMASWLLAVSLLARLTTLTRAQRIVAALPRRGIISAQSPAPAALAQAIDAILRLELPVFRDGRCWKRAMVLQRWLARGGVECHVTFGVRRTATGALQGHAWLARDGQPFLEPADTRTETYVKTFSLPRTDGHATPDDETLAVAATAMGEPR